MKTKLGEKLLKWRVIQMQEYNGPMNMALDEAVSESVRAGGQPTMRFFSWNPDCVTIGYHQSLEEEVNLEECEKRGFGVVRRLTGGGAVFHDRTGEITYSVIAPETIFPKDIIASYREICGWIIEGLGELGVKAEFKPINDVIASGKKISGNAQTRRRGVLQQHGTILYGLDIKTMFGVLKVSKEKISDKLIASVEERVTSLDRMGSSTRGEAYRALVKSFTKGKEFEFGDFTKEEINRAIDLAESKYSSREWNYQR